MPLDLNSKETHTYIQRPLKLRNRDWRVKAWNVAVQQKAKKKALHRQVSLWVLVISKGWFYVNHLQTGWMAHIMHRSFNKLSEQHWRKHWTPKQNTFWLMETHRKILNCLNKQLHALEERLLSFLPVLPIWVQSKIYSTKYVVNSRSKLAREQKITTKTREKFSNPVQNLLESFSIEPIDKIIEFVPRSIDMIPKRCRQRI